jgi:hypothetical protein
LGLVNSRKKFGTQQEKILGLVSCRKKYWAWSAAGKNIGPGQQQEKILGLVSSRKKYWAWSAAGKIWAGLSPLKVCWYKAALTSVAWSDFHRKFL